MIIYELVIDQEEAGIRETTKSLSLVHLGSRIRPRYAVVFSRISL